MTNPFQSDAEAKRYGKYRPRYHDIPMQKIREHIGGDFEYGLDVACGTGHSTEALSKIVKRVVGCDPSESMLMEARESFEFEFIRAAAENLPFPNSSFDLVNISMGFHWVDQKKFLTEAKRVLKDEGCLVIDNYGFKGTISNDPLKQEMHNQLMKDQLPPASEKSRYPTKELAQNARLEIVSEFKYTHKIPFDAAEFSNFIMTWSHFQVLSPDEKIAVAQQIEQTYGHIFESQVLNLEFVGKTEIYRPSYGHY